MNDIQTTTVTTYSRLHLGLHDCGHATDRIFGGVGIAFKGFPTTVTIRPAEETSVTFSSLLTPSDRTLHSVQGLVSRLEPVFGTFSIEITAAAPEHMGFGSKTSLLLAVTQAIAAANGQQATPDDLVRLTQRGGTSGIGVNVFWNGGLIADGGHPAGAERMFAPSAARTAENIAPVISRAEMPADWNVRLFYDPAFIPIEGEQEKKQFTELMPLPEIENLRAIATTYHGLMPAAIEHDIKQFARALYAMNHAGMKLHEVSLQTDRTKKFLNDMWEAGFAAGLTSFGPAVFVIDERGGGALEHAAFLADKGGLNDLGVYEFDNAGIHQG